MSRRSTHFPSPGRAGGDADLRYRRRSRSTRRGRQLPRKDRALPRPQPGGTAGEGPFTVGEMESRLGAFGFGWKDTTAMQAYTVHDFHPVMADELVRRGAMRYGLTWHFARPPVIDLEYEMDCRRVMREMVI